MSTTFYTRLLIIFLVLLAIVTGFNFFQKPFWHESASLSTTDSEVSVSVQAPSPSVSQVSEQSMKLSYEEKIWQLLTLPLVIEPKSWQDTGKSAVEDASASAQLEFIAQNKPGFILLYGNQVDALTVKQTITKIRQLYPESSPQPIIMVDHEGGRVQRLSGEGFTNLPSWQKLCNLPEIERAKYLDQSAQELSGVGIDLVLGPVVDVASKSAFLKDRACSGDPKQVVAATDAFIQIFLSHNLAAVIKHYPGIGSITKDIHLQFDRQTVSANDIFPFDSILEKYPTLGVMSTHTGVLGKNEDLPCSLSAECLLALVSTFPKTLIFSDDLTMKAASYNAQNKSYDKKLDQISAEALMAGNQVLLFGQGVSSGEYKTVVEKLLELSSSQPDFQQKIGLALDRVLIFKEQQFGKI